MKARYLTAVVVVGLSSTGCIDFLAEPPPRLAEDREAGTIVGEGAPEVGAEPSVDATPDIGVAPLVDTGPGQDADAVPSTDTALDMAPVQGADVGPTSDRGLEPEQDEGPEVVADVGLPVRLSRPHPMQGDNYGYSIATSDGTVAVGAPGVSFITRQAGSVYLYEDGWDAPQVLSIQDPGQCGGDGFGNVLDMRSGALVVGAKGFGPRANCMDRPEEAASGEAFVFEPGPDGQWRQVARLAGDDLEQEDRFGNAVAIWDDWIVVGAAGAGPAGRAFAYRRDGDGNWQPDGELIPKMPLAAGETFGWSVDIDDGRIAVGVHNRGVAPNRGAVFLFRRIDGHWRETALIEPPADPPAQQFGRTVALQGSTLVVSVLNLIGRRPPLPHAAGAVYAYDLVAPAGATEDVAVIRGSLFADRPMPRANFGQSLAVEGDMLLIGAPGQELSTPDRPGFAECPFDPNRSLCLRCNPAAASCGHEDPRCEPCEGDICVQCNAGVTHVFRRTPNGWSPAGQIQAEVPGHNHYFGWSVAWFGRRILVGVPQHADTCAGGCEAGSGEVQVFEAPE